jgi:3-methylcrotonyl-CoA carboxylase alpha subunit
MPFVRWDVGVEQGGQVSPFYDPMIGKVIVWGATRTQAIERMAHALAHTQIHGVKTNLQFLEQLVQAQRFRDDSHDTGFIEREPLPALAADSQLPGDVEALLLAKAPVAESTGQSHEGGSRWKRHHRS